MLRAPFLATILAGALAGSALAQAPDAGCALLSERARQIRMRNDGGPGLRRNLTYLFPAWALASPTPALGAASDRALTVSVHTVPRATVGTTGLRRETPTETAATPRLSPPR